MFDFLPPESYVLTPDSGGSVKWSSPSNIALIKYWGKKSGQIPENPSLSLSLEWAKTITIVEYRIRKEKGFSREFLFEGKPAPAFEPKLDKFFHEINDYLPFLSRIHLKIKSSNTFPHSTGIASSASSMSALAICLMDISNKLTEKPEDYEVIRRKASFLARIGSGSASRSIYPGYVVWGKSEHIKGSSDEYAIGLKLPEESFFSKIKDAILIVSTGKKEVSSTAGHSLMNTNPFANQRYSHARENLSLLLKAIKQEDKSEFIQITENEALTLHGLMMSSHPGYLLLNGGSIEIIKRIRDFRKSTGTFITFTLDAGPNVHLLYHEKDHDQVAKFIETELTPFMEDGKVIWDGIGKGPVKQNF